MTTSDLPRSGTPGCTVWFTGLPSAGKSTIARGVEARLRAEGRAVQVLDGDEVRGELTADLGFSRRDRDENVRRIGYVARLLAANGVVVLVPVIAPYEDARRAVRARHREAGVPYIEVYVDTPVDVCAARDVKGLYARQRAGLLTGLTGADDPYEPPERPDLRVRAATESVGGSVAAVCRMLWSMPCPADQMPYSVKQL